ncbi:MAG: type II secretion system protein [Candidatus Roizmanbacteria bacterium]|nr:type II secretion system protein [Candidatus Roizmanbacteria bacterium]
MFKNRKGFTLIELLVVIGILAVLLAITLIAVNPAQNLQDADDTKRRSDVNAILNAVSQYMVDNNGVAPTAITATPTDLGNLGINICTLIVPTYIAALPQDPLSSNGVDISAGDCAGTYSTGYDISAAGNRIMVDAPDANSGPGTITVTR